MRLGEDDRWRAVGVLSARIWLDQSRAASGWAYAYVFHHSRENDRLAGSGRGRLSSQLWKTIVLRGLHMCVCHHSHGNVQQGVAAVSLRDCAVRGSNQSDPRGLGKSDVDQESRFAARNAQFATSVERFLGFEHVGRHCLATPFLGL
jgi:hypothetical protein